MSDVGKPARVTPRFAPSGRRIRLGAAAALAGTFVIVAGELRDPLPTHGEGSAPSGPTPGASVVWLERLPAAERPSFEVPEGWQLVTEAPPPRREITRLAGHRGRIRTRSS